MSPNVSDSVKRELKNALVALFKPLIQVVIAFKFSFLKSAYLSVILSFLHAQKLSELEPECF